MTTCRPGWFPEPDAPYPNHVAVAHEHNLTVLPTVKRNPNGTFSSLWECSLCPDIFVGDHVGPIPSGRCVGCGWVQRKWPRKRCENCGRDMPKDPVEEDVEDIAHYREKAEEAERALETMRRDIVGVLDHTEWGSWRGKTRLIARIHEAMDSRTKEKTDG